jgi:micrococcal nuclease
VRRIQKRKLIFLIGTVVVAAVLFFLVCEFRIGFGNKGVYSGSDSYNKTAWKFADMVQSGVQYPVVRDIDGDTIVADVDGHDLTVRLIGADTPETVDPRKSVQCYGPQASAEAKRIFGEKMADATTTGVSVYLEKDPLKGDYDKYGRLLAYVSLAETIIPVAGADDGIASGTDLYNEYMIMYGFAHEYTFSNQPYKYQAQFKTDELAAKNARVGLWGNCPEGGD